MLLDSNIIIYASMPQHADLRRFIQTHNPAVSAVSYVEVLGYHQLSDQERIFLEAFFAVSLILPISNAILDKAVELRQIRKMSLGNSLIAATALIHQRALVTRNTQDFSWISALPLVNPFTTTGP